MAVKKRAQKKKSTAGTRRRTPRRGRQSAPRRRGWRTLLAVLTVGIGALAAAYAFGPFQLRGQMERAALSTIDAIRRPAGMPRPIAAILNRLYDRIPGSEGLEVEGGELGDQQSALLAGLPVAKQPLRVLRNQSYINLYDAQQRQSRAVAFRIDPNPGPHAAAPQQFFADPRLPQRSVQELQRGPWQPQPLAPAAALAQTYAAVGANEAHLVSNLVPMAAGTELVWQRLMHELTVCYPERFGEMWLYVGPVTGPQSPQLTSGVPIPDSLYAIAFDLTASGGLRAIAFLVPQHAADAPLHHYLTSIAHIEQLTGLQFLPEVDYHAREVLRAAVSPGLW